MTVLPALIAGSLQTLPMLGMVLLLCLVCPRSSPCLRHVALATALGVLLLLPLCALWLPEIALPVLAPVPGAVGVAGPDSSPVRTAVTSASLGGFRPAAGGAIAGVWLAGATLLAIRLATGLAGASRCVSAAIVGGRVMRVGAGRRTRVVFSPTVRMPMASGLFRPTVLLPDEALRWPRARRRAVLRHEFAHIRRADAWTLLVARVVRMFHWFNPLVWLAGEQLRSASEEACDAVVTTRELTPIAYADVLVDLARKAGCTRAPTPLSTIASAARLRVRVRRLVEGGWHPPRRIAAAVIGGALLASPILLAMARPTFTDGSTRAYAERYGVAPELAREVLEAAGAERVEPGIAFGLVSVESGFGTSRVSPGGAVGLAQVLPATADLLQPGLTLDELRQPRTNLRLGFRLLRGYMEVFSGDLERALLAYAVGPRSAASGLSDDLPYPTLVLEAARSGAQPVP